MSIRRSKVISAVALLCGATLALSACGSGTSGNGGGGGTQNANPGEVGGADQVLKRPKVNDIGAIAIAVEEGFTSYQNNTGATNNSGNLRVESLTQPSIYHADNAGGKSVLKIDGDLMDSVKVTSTTPQVVEYKFRKEAVWSDGQPIGCKDMYLLWLAATAKGADGKQGTLFDVDPGGYEQISKLECSADGKTATLTYSKPFADYRALFGLGSNSSLLPAHVLEQKTGIADITKVTDATADDVKKAATFYDKGWDGFDATVDVSGGPYVLQSVDGTNQYVLVRNDKYYGNAPGPAKLTFRTNSDAQSAAQQLQNKEIQVMDVQADAPVATQLRAAGEGISVYVLGGLTYEHVDFNMALPLFKDNPELRKAVALCTDRQGIVNNLVKDVYPNAKPLGNFLFMPNELGYEDHYSDIGKGDATAAKKILEDAGWKLGADGIYTKGTYRASFRLGHKVLPRRADTVRLMAASCKGAGIDIQDDQSADFNSKRLSAHAFDAALFAWVGTPAKAGMVGNYHTGGSADYNQYSNTAVDDTFQKANEELDFTRRTTLLNQVDKLMHDDYHSIPLFQLPDYTAYDSQLTGISYDGAFGLVAWNAYAWQKK